jgi:hypothetical protein
LPIGAPFVATFYSQVTGVGKHGCAAALPALSSDGLRISNTSRWQLRRRSHYLTMSAIAHQ